MKRTVHEDHINDCIVRMHQDRMPGFVVWVVETGREAELLLRVIRGYLKRHGMERYRAFRETVYDDGCPTQIWVGLTLRKEFTTSRKIS